MAIIFEMKCSLGKLTVENNALDTVVVVIKRLGYNKSFGRDKVTSIEHGIGGGSIGFAHTVKIHLLGGEVVVMKNVKKENAETLQSLLS